MCPDWLDHMLLILALAYWILLAFTLVATQRYLLVMWCSSNQQRVCSLFFMGRQRIERLQVRAAEALNALLGALFSESQKWGRVRPPRELRQVLCGLVNGTSQTKTAGGNTPEKAAQIL
jgi:hypothetical protein